MRYWIGSVWFDRSGRDGEASRDPTHLTLQELIATKPRHQRGVLAPGERFPTGARPGRRRARGVDLDSIGPYVPGDDVRAMDWRASARTGRAQMKRFVAESHIARMIIIDMRAHMFFGTAPHPMAKTAALLAGRMAWEALSLHEPVGLIVVPEPEVVRPRRGRGQILRLLDHVSDSFARLRERTVPDASSSFASSLELAATLLRRGDEICALSDFAQTDDALDEAAASLAEIRCLRAIVIEDALFDRPVAHGRYPMRQNVSAERTVAHVPKDSDAHHRAAVTAQRRAVQTRLTSKGWQLAQRVGARPVRARS